MDNASSRTISLSSICSDAIRSWLYALIAQFRGHSADGSRPELLLWTVMEFRLTETPFSWCNLPEESHRKVPCGETYWLYGWSPPPTPHSPFFPLPLFFPSNSSSLHIPSWLPQPSDEILVNSSWGLNLVMGHYVRSSPAILLVTASPSTGIHGRSRAVNHLSDSDRSPPNWSDNPGWSFPLARYQRSFPEHPSSALITSHNDFHCSVHFWFWSGQNGAFWGPVQSHRRSGAWLAFQLTPWPLAVFDGWLSICKNYSWILVANNSPCISFTSFRQTSFQTNQRIIYIYAVVKSWGRLLLNWPQCVWSPSRMSEPICLRRAQMEAQLSCSRHEPLSQISKAISTGEQWSESHMQQKPTP